jgi:hypothetical protein
VIGAFDSVFVDIESDDRLVLVRALILGSWLILGRSGLALGLSGGLVLGRGRARLFPGLRGRFLGRTGSRQCRRANQCKRTG